MNKHIICFRHLLILLPLVFGIFGALITVWMVKSGEARQIEPISPAQAPTISAINPQDAPNDMDTAVIITGTHFVVIISGTEIITPPTVRLGDVTLIDVTWISNTLLTGTVGWGMEPGIYTLTVTNPDGAFGIFQSAFTVTQGIGAWTSGGPYGGYIHDIDVNPSNIAKIYSVVDNVGVFGSTNAGLDWEPLLIDLPAPRLAIDPNNPELMYIKTSSGFQRTQDGGNSWETVNVPICYGGGEYHPFINPVYTDTVFIAAHCVSESHTSGVWRSDDKGDTWTQLGLADQNIMELAFHPENPLIIYAGEWEGGIYTSFDGGENWNLAYTLEDGYLFYLVVNPFGSHDVWVTTHVPYLLYHSKKPDLTEWELKTITNDPIRSITFHPSISGTIYLATSLSGFQPGAYSVDGGNSWLPLGEGLPQVSYFAVEPSPSATLTSTVLYAGGDLGIWKSINGGQTWMDSNNHLAGIVPSSIAVSSQNPYLVYAAGNNNTTLWNSYNGGQAWLTINPPGGSPGTNGSGGDIVLDPFVQERVYQCSGWSELQLTFPAVNISEDGGGSWNTIQITTPVSYADWNSWTDYITFDPLVSGHLLLGVTFQSPDQMVQAGGFYSSDDYGETWNYIDTGLAIGPIFNIIFAPSDSQIVYATTLASDLVNGAGLIKSTNGGATWQPIADEVSFALAIAVNPEDSQDVYVLWPTPEMNRIFHSQDGGINWVMTGGLFDIGIVWSLAFTPSKPPILYAGTMRMGLQRYDLASDQWKTAFGGEGVQVLSLATTTNAERTIIYLGTSGAAGSLYPEAGKFSQAYQIPAAGVYRFTQTVQSLYLPMIHR